MQQIEECDSVIGDIRVAPVLDVNLRFVGVGSSAIRKFTPSSVLRRRYLARNRHVVRNPKSPISECGVSSGVSWFWDSVRFAAS